MCDVPLQVTGHERTSTLGNDLGYRANHPDHGLRRGRPRTTATGAACTENIRLIREMMVPVKPDDLTDDEAAAIVEILKAARDR